MSLTAFAVVFDLSELWVAWARSHEGWAFDEIPVVLALASAAFAWYACRRRQDYGRELRAHVRTNQQLEREIAERRETEQALRESEALLRDAIESISEGFIVYDADERLVLWNRRYIELYPDFADFLEPGMRLEEVLRIAGERGQSVEAIADLETWLRTRLEAYRTARGSQELYIRDRRWVRASQRRTQGGGIVGIRTDITERKLAEDTIWNMAHTDSLTDLPNRQQFQQRLEEAVKNAERLERLVAVLFLDLDRFKDVNDHFGHPVGDELLRAVAGQLRRLVRQTDTVARLGGDEFAVILTNLKGTEACDSMAMRIVEQLAQAQVIDGCYLSAGTSVGISFYPLDDTEPNELVRKADLALYQAKADGRGCYHVYDEELHQRVKARAALEAELKLAAQRQEFVLHYQAQVCIHSGAVIGAEALIRWQHPERGLVPPGEWISIAESSGLIIEIGEWALRTACAQNKAWQAAGLPPLRMAVNIAGCQFQSDALVPTIEAALAESGLDPKWLELEITESMVIDGVAQVIEKLRRLNQLGVELAIDDFGTGYSSLAHLKHFPVQRLKIDRSFVQNVTGDADDKAIAEAVIRLGHSLELTVIAEGVETKEQLAFLSGQGCDEAQGFLFCRPQPAADFAEWLSLRPRRDEPAVAG